MFSCVPIEYKGVTPRDIHVNMINKGTSVMFVRGLLSHIRASMRREWLIPIPIVLVYLQLAIKSNDIGAWFFSSFQLFRIMWVRYLSVVCENISISFRILEVVMWRSCKCLMVVIHIL